MLKKTAMIVLILSLALCAFACADEFVIPFEGEGTEEKPYLIGTKEDLLQLAAMTNDQALNHEYITNDKHYRLTADIALNDCSDFDAWDVNPPETAWMPIGFAYRFRGTFDGNGHTISGLYIDAAVEDDGKGHIINSFGLFGNFGERRQGAIKNLNIEKAFVRPECAPEKAGANCGILVGTASSDISGCTVEGVVICQKGNFGGIAGTLYAEISDCSFQGKTIERSCSASGVYSGGIAGSNAGSIRNCSVSAQLLSEGSGESGNSGDMGGIAGNLSSDLPIGHGDSEQFNNIIENCSFNGEIRSGATAGGIVGQLCAIGGGETAARATILNCVNNGVVIAAEEAGGIAGCVWTSSSIHELWVDGCSNRGTVRSLSADIGGTGGIIGYIDTRNDGPVVITDCTNEAALCANCPGGIAGRIMQNHGNVRIENCTNKGAIQGEGSYAAGIVDYVQQWGDNWSLVIDQCINEADIHTLRNAGGIVCFAFDTGSADSSMTISNCINRANLHSDGINNYMGGILGVNSMANVPVNIENCVNEGDLEYTNEMLIDAETLSGNLFTLARISGGIVGYAGFTPHLSVNSGERAVNNLHVDDARLTIANCSSTGRFVHQEARFADDVDNSVLEAWRSSSHDDVLNFFISLEGGMLGTIADDAAYSVKITDCSYENIEREIDDWNRYYTE